MSKNKIFIIIFAALLFIFHANNISLAIEESKSCYPDYAYEFTGKDKFEKFNRRMFNFNIKFNKYVLRPVNTVWGSVVPKYGMDRIQNACTNIEYPIRLTSCLLQKDFKASRTETARFLTNTTLGLGGLYDPAKTRFKMEPRSEDMGQMLAHYKMKQGPYVVLPIVTQGNTRDIAGQVLNIPFNPTSYVIGPVAMIAKAAVLINKTSYMQPLIKTINSTYVDPYDITRKLVGVEKYIKNENLDRLEVLAQKSTAQRLVPVSSPAMASIDKLMPVVDLKADVHLSGYNPQTPAIDSMRTALFTDQKIDESKWVELSVWNRCFSKKIKISSVNIFPGRVNYEYRYILQKNANSPLAIIYPSTGEGIRSYHSIVLAKMFYDEGYSVLIQGSALQWEFVKSMPKDYRPGLPRQDANYLRTVSARIIEDLQKKHKCNFTEKTIVGTSFGATTALFVAAEEEEHNTLGLSKVIAINPPVELLFAIKQCDNFLHSWGNNPSDLKMRVAVVAEKVIQEYQKINEDKKEDAVKNVANIVDRELPFTDEEARLILGFVMQQKLSDIIYTIENEEKVGEKKGSKYSKNDIYKMINNIDFDAYAQKYLAVSDYESYDKLNHDTSLYSIANFLKTSQKYKIYHAADDYYANQDQLRWLKKQSGNKMVLFNNGSHLGFLYRKEFQDEFINDIKQISIVEKQYQKISAPAGGI